MVPWCLAGFFCFNFKGCSFVFPSARAVLTVLNFHEVFIHSQWVKFYAGKNQTA